LTRGGISRDSVARP